jgi:cold shock protein
MNEVEEIAPKSVGVVRWFNESKGYGFLELENGGGDVFCHITAVNRSGLDTLREGQKVKFQLVVDRKSGRSKADSLELVL